MLWKNRLVVSVAAAGAISAAAFGGIAATTNATTNDSASPGASSVAVVERAASDAAPAAPTQFSPAQTGDLQTVQLNEDGERGPRRGGGDLAEFLGIEPEALREQLQAGATPGEIAAANGSSAQALIDYLLSEAQTHINDAVTNGDLTQVQADERLAQVTERVTTFVNEGPQQGEGRQGRHHRGHRVLGAAAEAIGIEPQVLVAGIQAGSTVADVAAANGSSGQAVNDALVAGVSEHIDAAVAAGDMTAEEGAAKLAQASERINTFVFDTPELPQRGERGERGQRGPGGPPAGAQGAQASASSDF